MSNNLRKLYLFSNIRTTSHRFLLKAVALAIMIIHILLYLLKRRSVEHKTIPCLARFSKDAGQTYAQDDRNEIATKLRVHRLKYVLDH